MSIIMRLFKRLASASIWAPGAIPASEQKYAVPLKRWVLPTFDVLMTIGGVYAIHTGMPSFEALLRSIALGLAYLFAASGLVCLVGISFPHLWRVEIIGKIALIVLLGMYAIALFYRGAPSTGFTYLALILVPLFRLWIIGWEYAERRDEDDV